MKNPIAPPAATTPLPPGEVDREYRRLRRNVFLGIFIGYAGYYLVRKNFSLAMPFLLQPESGGFNKADLGWGLSMISIAYGLSKFLMGSISDRSNARLFLPLGLILTSAVMLCMGLFNWATASILSICILLFANGWFQGMGWPPCGRVMVHWFCLRERGIKMSVWNVAHNVGGLLMAPLAMLGMWLFNDNWHSIFFFPACVSILVAIVAWWLIRDTPQSCGLPPIEIYKGNQSETYSAKDEKEFSVRDILMKHVLNNKELWLIAIANAFVYFIRYGVLDWAPTYLKVEKGFDFAKSSGAYFSFEFAGIFGTILCGWISDKVFKGRRAPANALFMTATLVALLVYWLNPKGHPMVDVGALFAIGFLIYGPIMLIGVQAIDIVSKKAAGTAAGFTGLFGYFLGTAVFANIGIGLVVERFGWNASFIMLVTSCVITILIMLWSSFHPHKARIANSDPS